MLTIALLGMMVVDYYYGEDTHVRQKYKPMQLFLCIAIALVGVYIAMKFISPPATGTDRSNTWYTDYNKERLIITLRTFWMSLLPLPVPSPPQFLEFEFLLSKRYQRTYFYIVKHPLSGYFYFQLNALFQKIRCGPVLCGNNRFCAAILLRQQYHIRDIFG